MSKIGSIIFQLAMIALNAVFACAEIAVLSVNDAKLAQLKEQGDKRAKRIEKMIKQPSRFLATIQVAITLAGFLGSAFAANNFEADMVWLLQKTGLDLSVETYSAISVVLITLVLSYITLVFGELVPKRVAMKKAEKMALGMSGLLNFVATLTAPIVWFLTCSTNAVLRLMGIDPNSTENVTSEEDIKMMVDESSKQGLIDTDEKEIIHNLFEFDDLPVGEFATHRTDVDILWMEDDVAAWNDTIIEARRSYYPVCGETADEIKGILCAKDFFALKTKTKEAILKSAVRPAHFVPETLKADVLFKQMKTARNHFAVVLDEYGGFFGIVTMNDLLAQIMGDFDDDIEEGEEVLDIEKVSDDTWRIKGIVPLDEVNEALGIELPVDEYDTFGGYVFGIYGGIPEDGSTFTVETDELSVFGEEVDGHRLEMAKVVLKPKPENENEEEE